MGACDRWNTVRYRGTRRGHYESWFVRANHPTQARAFWIRYTIFSPKGRPEDAVGELWAIAFDQEADRVVAAKSVVPIAQSRFSQTTTDVRVGDASLSATALEGAVTMGETTVSWSLQYAGTDAPLLLLPEPLYKAPLPKAKALVPQPSVTFKGHLVVDGERWEIADWVGSQNHNWGSKHTDHYAWAQVAGFDDAPGVFFECATARIKLGPLWTPPLTVAVLRLPDAEIRLNTIRQSIRASGTLDGLTWMVESATKDVELTARVSAPRGSFVGLTYPNPPGGSKTCLNSKLARCELTVRRRGHDELRLLTQHRAAFEILTDDPDPEIPVVV